MPSILTHSSLPLWVYVVIIVVGSIAVILPILIILRRRHVRAVVRKHSVRNQLSPTRRVTLRRGRMVPSSKYLSLTGSGFGLGHFSNLEEQTDAVEAKSRSKSPFEWWSTIMDRSQSRQGEMAHSTPTKAMFGSTLSVPEDAHHPVMMAFNPPTKTIMTAARQITAADGTLIPTQNQATLPSGPRPSKYTNFSRGFGCYNDPNLEPLDSARTTPIVTVSDHDQVTTVLGAICSSSNFSTTNLAASPSDSIGSEISGPGRAPEEPQSFLYSSSSSVFSIPEEPPSPLIVDTAARHSYFDTKFSLSKKTLSDNPNTSKLSDWRSSHPSNVDAASQPEATPEVEVMNPHESIHWSTRPDGVPVTKTSKKGNVLRKKSQHRNSQPQTIRSSHGM